MKEEIITTFYLCDELLKTMGIQDDPQAKTHYILRLGRHRRSDFATLAVANQTDVFRIDLFAVFQVFNTRKNVTYEIPGSCLREITC